MGIILLFAFILWIHITHSLIITQYPSVKNLASFALTALAFWEVLPVFNSFRKNFYSYIYNEFMDIYDSDKPQKNLSADVAKRDIAAIERCHLRQCHLTLDQVTFQWNGSTWGKASLPTCVTGQYIWLLKEVLADRQKRCFQFFDRWLVASRWHRSCSRRVGTSADSVRNLHSLTDQFQTFHPRISSTYLSQMQPVWPWQGSGKQFEYTQEDETQHVGETCALPLYFRSTQWAISPLL